MNKYNDKDWIGILECIKDVDNDRLKNTLYKASAFVRAWSFRVMRNKNYLYLCLKVVPTESVSRGIDRKLDVDRCVDKGY
jgi:hypothetical protein